MTFEGQYLTKEEYIALGGNPEIGDMPFSLLEFEARRKIDENTFNRLKDLESEDIPQEVKLCEFNLINSIQEFGQSMTQSASNGDKKSESTDGYSVTFGTASDIADIVKSKSSELNDIIKTYLLGVIVNEQHILYRGL